MATGSALNLSLLSRGVGEIKRNGTEKVDVIFEPQDYFNFVEQSHDRPFFLPPLQSRYGFSHEPSQISSRYTSSSSKDAVHLPKTFTTRKGALLLFSEDMAHRTKKPKHHEKHKSIGFYPDQDVTESTETLPSSADHDLKTVDDLAKSILSYGSFDEGKMNLKFLRKQRRRFDYERQIRPGFSAKRYLSTWTKTWDDTVLEKVISKGYLTEKSLFYYNPLLPHLSRRLNDDLSHYPTPYKLMRSMLMSPGSLSGYTFYRVRPESQETDYFDIPDDDLDEEGRVSRSRAAAGSVKVASLTADGHLKETIYGQLDKKAQAEVLTDLLVKGAVHYALEKQQEYVSKIIELSEDGSEIQKLPTFDMRQAVESMLLSNDHKNIPAKVLDANLPERDDQSHHSGSFKGGKLGAPRRGAGDHSVTWKDDASSASSGGPAPLTGPAPLSGHAPLPPIGQGHGDKSHTQLTPIGEASREHTQAYLRDKEEEEEEGWAGHRVIERQVEGQRSNRDEERKKREQDKRKARVSAHSVDLEGQVLGAHGLMSSSESVGPGSTHSSGWLPAVHKPQWKGSQQSLRSHGSRKASGSLIDGDVASGKGSIVYGPDGEVIKVGEAIKLSARQYETGVQDIHDANVLPPAMIDASEESDTEAPDVWKSQRPRSGRRSDQSILRRRDSVNEPPIRITITGCESPRSQVTEQDIIDKLTSHASQIADSVLSLNDAGQVLEEDIRRAAALWMETHPPREISRSQSVQDLPDNTVIQEVMKATKRKSAGPTVAEYRAKIKGNLLTALAKATGINQEDIPGDAEIDPDLLDQLAKDSLKPEDIEIVHDAESGRSFIRSRNRMIKEAMGGVEKGHIYQPAKNTDGKRVSIPTERKPQDIGEIDVVNYGQEKQPSDKAVSERTASEKAPSEVGSKKTMSVAGKADDSKSLKSAFSSKGVDEGDLSQALADLEKTGSPVKSSEAISLKSGKSDDKKSKVSEKKKDDFVVAAAVDHTKENTKIYGMGPSAAPKAPKPARKPKPKKAAASKPAPAKEGKAKGGKKGKGKKKKEEVEKEPATAVEAVSPVKEKTPDVPREPTPKPVTPETEKPTSVKSAGKSRSSSSISGSRSHKSESPKPYNSDDEEDYIIVRDETMSPEVPVDTGLNITTSVEEEPEELDEEGLILSATEGETEDMSEADKLRMISNREARNAKRAAAAEKRRQEVERKRREREEQIKREKEEQERQEKLKIELEEQRKRKEEERRLKAEQEEQEAANQMNEELEKQKREKAEQERERRRKEEYARKLEEMKKRHEEEEKKRQEEAERKALEEEERRKAEEEMMAKMAEEERIEYERKKKEEEEERKRLEEEEKRRREEEAQKAIEEARRLAEEMARKQAELEARLRFNRSLQLESEGMEHTQDITRAFVFSYYELLAWLGLNVEEFDLLKLHQYS
ncbi:uncharacterized protein LOC127847142 isoform X2 [Dreissena polymorpha]|uniref:uncharacterized protein LOC127847142 isoform X2 n=1 Tax=Dreissena polymorpha TaxID=45954 RepID=UPI0022652186|nr:uncharacterized protein LOC127847142 isoform X2 [Dreissena polymorpha]